MSGSDYMEFGFGAGDEKIGGGKFERFKAKEGENYRVSFVWWPIEGGKVQLDAKSPRFIGAKRFFIQNVGYVLDKGPEFAKIAGGPSKVTVATIIAVWPTNRKGELDKTRFMQGEVDVKPWIFSRTIYDQLKRRHDEWPFGQYDLAIACTDTQYQKMDLSPCRESLFRKAMETDKLKGLVDAIVGKVKEIEGGLQSMIAQDLTIEKVREKLGGGASSGATFSAESESQVDSILDDLIPE